MTLNIPWMMMMMMMLKWSYATSKRVFNLNFICSLFEIVASPSQQLQYFMKINFPFNLLCNIKFFWNSASLIFNRWMKCIVIWLPRDVSLMWKSIKKCRGQFCSDDWENPDFNSQSIVFEVKSFSSHWVCMYNNYRLSTYPYSLHEWARD